MKIKSLFFVVLLIMGLVSCIDDKYDLGNLDPAMEFSTELVGPLLSLVP